MTKLLGSAILSANSAVVLQRAAIPDQIVDDAPSPVAVAPWSARKKSKRLESLRRGLIHVYSPESTSISRLFVVTLRSLSSGGGSRLLISGKNTCSVSLAEPGKPRAI